MKIRGLKQATKDIDIVLENVHDFVLLQKSLNDLGYSRVAETEISGEDQRLYPSEILTDAAGGRVDLFTGRIMRQAVLSEGMKRGADYADYGNMRIGLLRREHVFLLKAVAGREGDIHDMKALVEGNADQAARFRYGGFDWDLVWDEIVYQEGMSHVRDFAADVFEQLVLLAEQTAVDVPFLGRLRRHVVDRMIQSVLRGGGQAQRRIVSLLKGTDITEKMIRNRIDVLERSRIIKKSTEGSGVMISLLTNPRFFYREWKIGRDTMTDYLDWRFPLAEKPSGRSMGDFADKLHRLGYETIGMVDDDVIDALDGKRHTDVALMCLQLTADIDGHEFRARG